MGSFRTYLTLLEYQPDHVSLHQLAEIHSQKYVSIYIHTGLEYLYFSFLFQGHAHSGYRRYTDGHR